MDLGQWQRLRLAIHRGRRTEHQRMHLGAPHGFEQPQRADHVVVVVAQRLLHRLAHRLQASKVHHCAGATVGQCVVQRGSVADVALVQLHALAGQCLHPRQHLARTVAEVVQHRHWVACRQQLHAGVAADVAGTAGDQDGGQAAGRVGRQIVGIHGRLYFWHGW